MNYAVLGIWRPCGIYRSRSSSPKSVLVDGGGVFHVVSVGQLLSDGVPCADGVVLGVGEVEPILKNDPSDES